MKTNFTIPCRRRDGYALLTVLSITAVSLIVVAGSVRRTTGVAKLNERNNLYNECQNAAEAAVEKVVARMAYDFHANGVGVVASSLSTYRQFVPTTGEDAYWSRFTFSDGQTAGRTSVQKLQDYSGPMPSQFPGLNTMQGPIYSIKSTATRTEGGNTVSATIQQDMLLALVPLPQWAIFANALLEFSTCATMEVRGRVHANSSIYVGAGAGAGSSSTLTFYDAVTSTGTMSAPNNAGYSWGSDWNTGFSTAYATNRPTVSLNFSMTNAHSMIELPPVGMTANSPDASTRLYYNAQTVMLVDDTGVTIRAQTPPSAGSLPGQDSSPVIWTNSLAGAKTNLPFLTLTNFTDQRESKTMLTTQIDVAKYGTWIRTNSAISSKFSGTYPTILYVADRRTVTSSQMNAIRLINGTVLPVNGGAGFSVATPNPLYVKGNYNVTNSAHLGTTNTSSTVPAALMSDALTILSSSWQDSQSASSYTSRSASSATTINACILTGMVPSTGPAQNQFGGGIHNLTRLLEDWGSSTLWLNTSLLYLYNSKTATTKFIYPGLSGTYYKPPNRKFSYDSNFMRLDRQPPGIPTALIAIHVNWQPL